nr:putative ribonuclease H-like domain-containing protein [Tanacetum cinerariifolium]
MYCFDLQNVVPSWDLTYLFAKVSIDESNLWRMRLGHVNVKTMNKLVKGNLVRVSVENQSDKNAGPQDTNGNVDDKAAYDKPKDDTGSMDALIKEFEQGCMDQRGAAKADNTNSFNTVSNPVNAASTSGTFSAGAPSSSHLDAFIPANTLLHVDQDDSQIPDLEDTAKLRSTGIFNSAYDDDLDIFTSPVQSVGAEADFNNMESSTVVSPILTHEVHIDHPKDQILEDPKSAIQTRGMAKKSSRAHDFVSYIHKKRRTNHKDYENYLFSYFLSQMEPKKVDQALDDERWVEAMQEELLQFSLQKGIVFRNKARLVAQGHGQEDGIDYDEVFASVARIEAIRIFLAFVSFMVFIVYQIYVKSAFLYGTIEEEVYVSQPPGFIDPQVLNKVYMVDKALYGLHQAPRAWYETLSTFLLQNGYRRGKIDKTLFNKKAKDDIMLVQVYVDDIIFRSTKKSLCDDFEALMDKRFQMSSMGELTFFLGLQVKQTSTPIETQKPLFKDEEAVDVDVHLYRSMIESLMYFPASRPDIMFAVCACSRFQVTPKLSHLHDVKRIF